MTVSKVPTAVLTKVPTAVLTKEPTAALMKAPVELFTITPVAVPVKAPTASLTTLPTASLISAPTALFTIAPSAAPKLEASVLSPRNARAGVDRQPPQLHNRRCLAQAPSARARALRPSGQRAGRTAAAAPRAAAPGSIKQRQAHSRSSGWRRK